MKFAKRTNIKPSATVTMNGLALQKRAAGERVYNLAAGEPMIETDARIIEAARKAMRDGRTHYTPVPGIPELRDAASGWMNENYATRFSSAQTLVTAGGKSAYHLIMQALIEPGDEVIMIAPFWVSYSSIAELYGGVPVIAQTSEQEAWKLTPDSLAKLCTSKTKMLVLNNASNPTGVLYSREELHALLKTANTHGLVIISDEVYSGLTYDGRTYVSAGSFPEYQDSVAVVQSASKQFAMTGWRVGFAFGPETLIRKLVTLQGQNTTCAASISQWAALAAFHHAGSIIQNVRDTMKMRRDAFVSAFNAAFKQSIALPHSALYAFIPLQSFGTGETDSEQFCIRSLEKANVAMVPGAAFGTEGYVRCSFGEREDELHDSIKQLAVCIAA